jgi:hypothetical protein
VNIRRAISDVRTWGLPRFLHQSVMNVLRPRLILCAIYVREHGDDPRLPPLPDGRYVRIATPEELLEAGTDPVYQLDPEFIHAAIAKGDLCVALFQERRLLAYFWKATGKTPHLGGLWVQFATGYCYSYKAFTHPDFRQGGLQRIVATWTDPLLRRRGYSHSIGFVETHNFPSIRASERRGAVKAGYAGYVQVFGNVYTFRTPGAKHHGFRFFIPG